MVIIDMELVCTLLNLIFVALEILPIRCKIRELELYLQSRCNKLPIFDLLELTP